MIPNKTTIFIRKLGYNNTCISDKKKTLVSLNGWNIFDMKVNQYSKLIVVTIMIYGLNNNTIQLLFINLLRKYDGLSLSINIIIVINIHNLNQYF
jgi:hypothetical protein